MKVNVRYFASLREALGAGEAVETTPGATVGHVRDALISRGGAHAEVLARTRAVRTALDQVLCDDRALLRDGAELAFFPPVTGG
jgi:molybdopterin synthase sulfur carrier subunit